MSCELPPWHAALHDALTPGISTPRFTKYLPVGIASTVSLVNTVCRCTPCTSTIGASPVTVIVSSWAPTRISTLIVAVKSPAIVMPSRFTVLKPGSVKVTE